MALVEIHDGLAEGGGKWQTGLDFEGEGDFPVAVSGPFEKQDERLLRWFSSTDSPQRVALRSARCGYR